MDELQIGWVYLIYHSLGAEAFLNAGPTYQNATPQARYVK